MYYGTLIALTGLVCVALMVTSVFVHRLNSVPGWYQNPDTTESAQTVLKMIKSDTLSKVGLGFTLAPQTIEQNVSSNAAVHNYNTKIVPLHLPKPISEKENSTIVDGNRSEPNPKPKQYVPPSSVITADQLSLVLVSSLEDKLKTDIRHGIEYIKTRITPENLVIESRLNADYLDKIPVLKNNVVWKSLRYSGGHDLFLRFEGIPSSGNDISQLSPATNLMIGNQKLTLPQLQQYLGISPAVISQFSRGKSFRLKEGYALIKSSDNPFERDH